MQLHGYFRSTASYRVRVALNLKGMSYEGASHHLRKGEQRAPSYLALNPQGLVPTLVLDDGRVLTQSLAICEYLDEIQPEPPLLPREPVARAQVRAFAQVIACDVHPIQNLKILARLRGCGLSEAQVNDWAGTIIKEGLDACDRLLARQSGPYCFGAHVTLADLVLVPQLINARRFGVSLDWPHLLAIEETCLRLPAFQAAAPEQQQDCE
jgi:maleylpyruvate isomerase